MTTKEMVDILRESYEEYKVLNISRAESLAMKVTDFLYGNYDWYTASDLWIVLTSQVVRDGRNRRKWVNAMKNL